MISYIVALYFGPRMNQKYSIKINEDPLYFFKKHIEFLDKCDPLVISPTFVVNGSYPKEFLNYIKDYNIIFRENTGFSYGAWNAAIKHHLMQNTDVDYFFMLEDDYIPSTVDFYLPFVNLAVKETPLVCCKAGKDGDQPLHPQISNGIIRKDICQEIYNMYSDVFWYNNPVSYEFAYHTQVFYIKYLLELGYGFTDISDEYCSIFKNSTNNSNVIFGDPNKQSLIIPIEV